MNEYEDKLIRMTKDFADDLEHNIEDSEFSEEEISIMIRYLQGSVVSQFAHTISSTLFWKGRKADGKNQS